MTDPTGTWSSPDGRAPVPEPESVAPTTAPTTAPLTAAVPPRGSGRAGRPVVPLRPLGLGELLDGSVAVLRRYPRPVFAVSAVVAVLTGALQLVTSLVVLAPLRGTTAGGLAADSGALESFLGGTAVATVVSLLLGTLATAVLTGFVTIVVSRAVLEQGTTLREGWELLRPRIGRLLLTALALAGTTFGLVLLSFVALGGLVAALGGAGGALGALVVLAALGTAAWLYIRWSLATAAVVLEKTGVRVALKRSAVLARGDFWRILGVLLLAVVIASFVGQVVQVPLAFAGSSPLSSLGSSTFSLSSTDIVIASVAGSLSTTLTGPFTAGVRALLYVDRRMRAEGLDVALVAAAAARR